jgi:nascent polypeptide-associated complex subunit alpha
MLPGNPRQMQQMLRQMGIKSREIDANKVTIECKDGTNIIIEQPNITEMDMKGEKNYTIAGKIREETALSEEDIELVMESTKVGREEAIKALKEHGDVASAIVKLQE